MKTLNTFATAAALGTALAASVAAPVLAGGYAEPVTEPTIAPVMIEEMPVSADWTGGYVGGSLGYGQGSVGATDHSGMTYGLRAGYDYDFGSWVLGAGLDYDKGELDLDGGAGTIDSVSRLKLRAGADLGRTLVYGTGGLAHAEAEVGGLNLSDNGYFAGIGAEHMLNDAWSVGGEILVHKFDNFDNSGTDVDATTASLNVNYRF